MKDIIFTIDKKDIFSFWVYIIFNSYSQYYYLIDSYDLRLLILISS